MQTIDDKNPATADCVWLRIHHHGDWSGDAIVVWFPDRASEHVEVQVLAHDFLRGHLPGVPQRVACRAVALAVREYMRSTVIDRLEGLFDREEATMNTPWSGTD